RVPRRLRRQPWRREIPRVCHRRWLADQICQLDRVDRLSRVGSVTGTIGAGRKPPALAGAVMTLLAVIVVVDLLLAFAIAAPSFRPRRFTIRRGLHRRKSGRFERAQPRLMELLRSDDDDVLIETLVAAGRHAVEAAPALVPVVEIVRERTGRVQFVAA